MDPNSEVVNVDPNQVAQVLKQKLGDKELQLAMEEVARQQLLRENAQLKSRIQALETQVAELQQGTEEEEE